MRQHGCSCSIALVAARFITVFQALVTVASERAHEGALEPASKDRPHAIPVLDYDPVLEYEPHANTSRALQVTSKVALVSLSSEATGQANKASSTSTWTETDGECRDASGLHSNYATISGGLASCKQKCSDDAKCDSFDAAASITAGHVTTCWLFDGTHRKHSGNGKAGKKCFVKNQVQKSQELLPEGDSDEATEITAEKNRLRALTKKNPGPRGIGVRLMEAEKIAEEGLASEGAIAGDTKPEEGKPNMTKKGDLIIYTNGDIEMADYLLGNDNRFESEDEAKKACSELSNAVDGLKAMTKADTNKTCRGYWQRRSGEFRLLVGGKRTWSATRKLPDDTVIMVKQKQICMTKSRGKGCIIAKIDHDYLFQQHVEHRKSLFQDDVLPEGSIGDIDHQKLLEYIPQLDTFEEKLSTHFHGGHYECAEFVGGEDTFGIDFSFGNFGSTNDWGCGWAPAQNDRSGMHIKDHKEPACECHRFQWCEQPGVDQFLYAYQQLDLESAVQVGKLYMAGRCYYPVKTPVILGIIIGLAIFVGWCRCCSRVKEFSEDPYLFNSFDENEESQENVNDVGESF